MIIQNYLDDVDTYLTIRDGIELFYFGSGCIVDYYSNSIAYLSETDINLLLLCCGENTIPEIIKKSLVVTEHSDKTLEFLNKMLSKGVLVFKNEVAKKALVINGKKSKYYPKEIAIELTDSCNYKCPFC